MVPIRKLVTLRETINSEMGRELPTPITRALGAAVIANPYAGRYAEDLGDLFAIGGDLGGRIAAEVAGLLVGPAVAYGKGALVGMSGEMEHGGACIHPMLGKPMRGAIGGGGAVIPSNVKMAALGASLDVPLGHKDNVWSFDHFDTMTVAIADAPRHDEIVVVLAFADGGRPFPRCGAGPV
ncbi:amino acid synthesis family protein [Fodinicurvata sp. EGI_FJ10296]|uniref:amino acid synthesis family protein n=1 Tax=Fodinicurvata sp. EGI_FJ10296 TaxID=3231908 RepID=UPI0034535E25